MPLRGDESYVEIEGKLAGRTARAIQIENDFATAWVPRSCIHFSTDQAANVMNIGDEGTFKIMEWIAEERGFI